MLLFLSIQIKGKGTLRLKLSTFRINTVQVEDIIDGMIDVIVYVRLPG